MSDDYAPIEAARLYGEAAVAKIAGEVDANMLERESMARLEKLVRHGYKFIDIIVRKDGQETRFEGDWIARLFRQAQRRKESAA